MQLYIHIVKCLNNIKILFLAILYLYIYPFIIFHNLFLYTKDYLRRMRKEKMIIKTD